MHRYIRSASKIKLPGFTALLFSGLSLLFINGICAQVETKLTASDGAGSDLFGISVSNDDNKSIIGSWFDDDNGLNSGSVYIFEWDGSSWVETKLTASDGSADDWFGESVSIDGNRAIVGSALDDDNGVNSGSVYIFEWDGSSWVETKLTASDGSADDWFGESVSIDGNRAIVGSALDDDNGVNSGSVYIFEWDGSSWVETKLTASDGTANDRYGFSASLSGDKVIVGAFLDDDNGSSSGSIYVYEWDGSSWVETKLTASDGAADDWFGYSVSIHDNIAVSGARFDNNNGIDSGSAYIFEWDGSNWVETKLTASDGAADDLYGTTVSINGNRVIVGAEADDDNGSESGSIYVYEWNGSSWIETKLTAGDGSLNDYYGTSVSIEGNRAVVGAYGDDDNGGSSGSAYIYDFISLNCDLIDLKNDSLRIYFSNGIDTVGSSLNVFSREEGLKAGSINIQGDTLSFVPNAAFLSGDDLQICIRGIKDNAGNNYDDKVFKECSPVTHSSSAVFDSLFTGITIPSSWIAHSYDFRVADFNRDGLIDVAFRYMQSAGASTNIVIYLQDAMGNFSSTTYTHSSSYSGLRGTPDLNADGYPDLILQHNVPSRIQVRLNNGDGTFGSANFYTVTNFCNGAVYGDIDADGDLDILAYAGNANLPMNTISILRNNGDGTFQAQETIDTGIFGSSLGTDDLDNDGDLDLVYTSNAAFGSQKKFRVYENDGTGTFSLIVDEDNDKLRQNNDIKDFNNDGFKDLLFKVPDLSIIYGNGILADFSISDTVSVDNENRRAVAGDLDGNGTIDLLNTHTHNGTDWTTLPFNTFLNDGMAFNFNAASIQLGTRTNYNLSDLDRDGDMDILYIDADGKLKYLYNIGNSCPSGIQTNNYTDNGSGLWMDTANWSLGELPDVCQNAVIQAGHSARIKSGETAQCNLLDIQNSAELIMEDTAELEAVAGNN